MNKKALKEKYKDEKVFVVPYNVIEDIEDKFTFRKHTDKIWSLYDQMGKYLYRYDVEGEPSVQQIIPYFVISNKDKSKYFVAKRIQGDARLINKMSLGFGGHINECDGYHKCVYNALIREMDEELNMGELLSEPTYLGTIRDVSSSTNDHFGLAFEVAANEDEVSIKETDNLAGKWMTKEELFDNYHKFEGWSKFLIDYLYESSR